MIAKTELSERISILSEIPLFVEMKENHTAMSSVAETLRKTTAAKGSTVFSEGDTGDLMYVVKSGNIEISKRTMQGDAYTVTILTAADHVFFGEMALLDNDCRSATITCQTDCEFYVMSRADFITLGNSHPATGLRITRELARIVSQRLRKANADIITLFDALVGEMVENEGL